MTTLPIVGRVRGEFSCIRWTRRPSVMYRFSMLFVAVPIWWPRTNLVVGTPKFLKDMIIGDAVLRVTGAACINDESWNSERLACPDSRVTMPNLMTCDADRLLVRRWSKC